ncbi:MAG: ABC transporter ATP-binding protein [Halieaceae bacterium]|nr:ABC transporter ATP-binding protein [Halieaceae bacterium]
MSDQLLIRMQNAGLKYNMKTAAGKRREHWVLNSIDLDIFRGQTVGLIGRNGAGKSSMLRVLAGLIDVDRGVVENHAARTVLLSFQLGFNNLLTGHENAIYMGLLLGMTRWEIESKLDEIARFSELGEALEQPLGKYSSGMRARLGFSIAIQVDADIILIDEALGVGDHAFREKSVAVMKDLIKSDKTILFVSHDQQHVKELCDRVVWLENGRIVDEGTPDSVFEHYYEYDHAVVSLAANLGVTEAEVRSHPNSAVPLDWLRKFRGNLKSQWNEEDEIYRSRKMFGLRIYRPARTVVCSQIVDEECGACTWVENRRQIARGERVEIEACHAGYVKFSESLLSRLNLTEAQYRETELCQRILDSLVRVGKSHMARAPRISGPLGDR